jgi:hypothetical protein
MTAPVLTFRDCGFGGRELARLGRYVIGAIEPAPLIGMRPRWSFYPDASRRLVGRPAPDVEAARALIAGRAFCMLYAMGLPAELTLEVVGR